MKFFNIFIIFILFIFGGVASCISKEHTASHVRSLLKIEYSYGGGVRVFAYDRVQGNFFVVRANTTNERVMIDFGRIRGGNGEVYPAALAICNEMKTSVVLTGITIDGLLSNYSIVHLHINADRLAENDYEKILIFDRGVHYQFEWHLSEGDGNYTTVKGGTLLYSRFNNIYYAGYNINASKKDFIWVQIRLRPPIPRGIYYGYITFYYIYGEIKMWYRVEVI